MKRIALCLCICFGLLVNIICVADQPSKAQEHINSILERAREITGKTSNSEYDVAIDDSQNEEADNPDDDIDGIDINTAVQWKAEHRYDFPIYGSTSVDLSPISDYLTLLSENGIYISLPDLSITHQEEREWIYSEIGESIYLRYIVYNDMSRYSLYLEVPLSYRPHDEALTLLIASVLSVDKGTADKLYERLRYNVIDEWCVIETDDYELSYYEPRYSDGRLMDFISLGVERKIN